MPENLFEGGHSRLELPVLLHRHKLSALLLFLSCVKLRLWLDEEQVFQMNCTLFLAIFMNFQALEQLRTCPISLTQLSLDLEQVIRFFFPLQQRLPSLEQVFGEFAKLPLYKLAPQQALFAPVPGQQHRHHPQSILVQIIHSQVDVLVLVLLVEVPLVSILQQLVDGLILKFPTTDKKLAFLNACFVGGGLRPDIAERHIGVENFIIFFQAGLEAGQVGPIAPVPTRHHLNSPSIAILGAHYLQAHNRVLVLCQNCQQFLDGPGAAGLVIGESVQDLLGGFLGLLAGDGVDDEVEEQVYLAVQGRVLPHVDDTIALTLVGADAGNLGLAPSHQLLNNNVYRIRADKQSLPGRRHGLGSLTHSQVPAQPRVVVEHFVALFAHGHVLHGAISQGIPQLLASPVADLAHQQHPHLACAPGSVLLLPGRKDNAVLGPPSSLQGYLLLLHSFVPAA